MYKEICRLTPRRALFFPVVLLALFLAFPCVAADPSYQEAVKGHFIYNISKFIYRPDQKSLIFICVYDNSDFFQKLEQVYQRDDSLYASRIKLRMIEPDQDIIGCDMVFIGRRSISRLQDFLDVVEGKKILTVSDIEGFIKNGGMIELVMVSQKTSLQINYGKIKRHGIQISSRLLNLADVVNGQERVRE